MKNIVLTITLFFLVIGCRTDKDLDVAKSLMHEHPDSSLVILQEWKAYHSFSSKRDKARYSLLLSMALDKNYIDITSDSIITTAVQYYAPHPCEERMLSYYYQGIVFKNMNATAAATVALEKAKEDAEVLGDWYYLGLINRNKAELFNETCNFPAAIQCAQESVACFRKANTPLYAQYSQLSLAISLINNKDYDEALSELNTLSQETSDQYLLHHLTLCKAHALWAKDAPANKLVHLYTQVPTVYYDVLDFGRLAESYEFLGKKDSTDYWMNVGYALAPTETYKVSLDFWQANLENGRGHYKEAYDLLKHVSSFQDSLTRIRLAESISAAQRDYFKQDRDLQKEMARVAATRLYLWITVLCFCIILILLLFIFQLRSKEALLRDGLATLHSNEVTINKLSSDNASLVGGLVNEKLKYLDELSNDYCQAESDVQKDQIFKLYKENLAKLQNNPKVFEEIEGQLNQYCGGLMRKFREQLPNVKGDKIRMVILFFTRIPYKKAALFFKYYNADSLKKAKNRLRNTILDSGAPDTDLFLNALEMKKGGRRQKQNDN
ncbi:MAG: hypothetical protein J5669_01115 [Bacteroidales bacterium]|nr:hypothetical protein [Bacteroidales bacterium]